MNLLESLRGGEAAANGHHRRIYLDHAAATPVDPAVQRAMRRAGNPSAVHREGQRARRAVEDARELIARTLRVRATDITFTSGGTESNNLAILGHLRALREARPSGAPHKIITTPIEHPAILRVLERAETDGHATVHHLDIDEYGCIKPASLKAALTEHTALLTFAYANSEIGTVQDVRRLVRVVEKYNREHGTSVRVHLDASQAPYWLPCQMDTLGVDMMTLDAGKCGGPAGSGILVHRKDTLLRPVLAGGGQENGLRPGTENLPAIVGGALALARAQTHGQERAARAHTLRDDAIALIKEHIPNAVLNGPEGEGRIANNISIAIPGLDAEFAVIWLDARGVAAATASACERDQSSGSDVIRALPLPGGDTARRARSTLRLTLGPATTRRELKRAINILAVHCNAS